MGAETAAEHEVVIVGAGPTGLALAAELALADVDVLVVERRATQDLDGRRAGGLHIRTLEVLDQRGVADRFLAAGQTHPAVGFAYVPLPVGDLPTRHPYLLALPQQETERVLAAWVDELGVPVRRDRSIVGVAPDGAGVEVELADGTAVRADWLVGCDGGRSAVRTAAGIAFPGVEPSTSWLVTEVQMDDEPVLGTRPGGGGIGPVDPSSAGGPYSVVVREPGLDHDGDPELDDLRAALHLAYGTDFGARRPTWISRFTDGTRQAVSYRAGRVLLAGDAAHVHPPHGGQGLNLGVQDAVNLGWKLAQVVRGTSPDALLDTYHDERHPVGAEVLRTTSAQVALTMPDDRHEALRATVAELLAMDEPRRRLAAAMSGLDVRYDMGDGHPVLGRRVPDLDLQTEAGPTRLYELLHPARPVLVDLGTPGGLDLGPWAGRVRAVVATAPSEWELPVVGPVEAPAAVLVRPDGHVAWAGAGDDDGLGAALTRWCGPAGGSDRAPSGGNQTGGR